MALFKKNKNKKVKDLKENIQKKKKQMERLKEDIFKMAEKIEEYKLSDSGLKRVKTTTEPATEPVRNTEELIKRNNILKENSNAELTKDSNEVLQRPTEELVEPEPIQRPMERVVQQQPMEQPMMYEEPTQKPMMYEEPVQQPQYQQPQYQQPQYQQPQHQQPVQPQPVDEKKIVVLTVQIPVEVEESQIQNFGELIAEYTREGKQIQLGSQVIDSKSIVDIRVM